MSKRDFSRDKLHHQSKMAARQQFQERGRTERLLDPDKELTARKTKAEIRAETDALMYVYQGSIRRIPIGESGSRSKSMRPATRRSR